MNLINLWEKTKIGQKIKRSVWTSVYLTKKYDSLGDFIHRYITDHELIANDWEIVKEKKVDVYLGVTAMTLYHGTNPYATQYVIFKNKVKITAEHEE